MFCRRPLVAGLLALALLSACGDDGAKPKVLPSASTSSSASVSTSPTPSTPAAAEAAARRYYAELSKAYATGDVSVLRSLHAASCPCKRLTDGIEGSWAKGSLEGGLYSVTGVRVVEAKQSAAAVQVDYEVSAIVQKDKAGKVIKSVAPLRNRRTLIDLVLFEDRFIVARITNLAG